MPNIKVDDPVYSILTRKRVELSALHGVEATYNMAIKFYINKFRENKDAITKNEETNEWIKKLLEESVKSSRSVLTDSNISQNYSKPPLPPSTSKIREKRFNPEAISDEEMEARKGIKEELTNILILDPKNKGLSSRKITKEDIIEEYNHWKKYYKTKNKLKPVKLNQLLIEHPFLSDVA